MNDECVELLGREFTAEARETIYRHVMRPHDLPDFKTGKFTVRQFDGMDGCWCDVATDVSGEEALRVWSDRTKDGTEKIKFADIDYYRIFPSDTHMVWDGSEGREMFR